MTPEPLSVRTLCLLTVFLLPILSGCEDDRFVVLNKQTCQSITEWLKLSQEEEKTCLKDKTARDAWEEKRDIALARSLTTSFNQERRIIEPRGYKLETFAAISTVKDLPGLISEGTLGNAYLLTARIGFSKPDNPRELAFIHVYDVRDSHEKDTEMVLASPHLLNDFQKAFLDKHCWTFVDKESSLCQGKIFLAVLRSPATGAEELEFVGASFDKADEETVIAAFKR